MLDSVPSTTTGAHTIKAVGSGGTYDTAMFTVPSAFSSGTTGQYPTNKPGQTQVAAKEEFGLL